MKRASSRLVVLWMLIALIFQLSGGTFVWAASGTVRGRIAVEGGTLPEGSQVRATPLDGGAARLVPVAQDGTYQFAQLSEGAYTFEVVGPDGAPLGSGTTTLVPPSALQLNLRARLQPVPGTTAATAGTPAVTGTTGKSGTAGKTGTTGTTTTASTTTPSPGWSSGKKWGLVGIIVGSAAVGLAAAGGGNNDNEASPSTP